jgi:hypothetical protein
VFTMPNPTPAGVAGDGLISGISSASARP